jgi:uroporphyrinogen decarboxylase
LDLGSGVPARELKALELVRDAVGADVHVMPTIFSPLTAAKQLAGDEAMLTHLRSHPEDLEAGLRAITDFTARFAAATLEHGADSIFFATQFASRDRLADEEHHRFGLAHDMPVLDAVRARAQVILVHLHGTRPMFELTDDYDADLVNWHDRETEPDLATGLARLRRGAVLGGLCRGRPLAYGHPSEVADQVRDSIERTGERRLVVGAGCVTLTSTPTENIRAACEAAREGAASVGGNLG